MPQDINQGIFPELAGEPMTNSHPKCILPAPLNEGCQTDALQYMEASVPGDASTGEKVDCGPSVTHSAMPAFKLQDGTEEACDTDPVNTNLSCPPVISSLMPPAHSSISRLCGPMENTVYPSGDSPRECVPPDLSVEKESSSSGQFSQQDDWPHTMMQCETSWPGNTSQTEELLFHFDRFFRRRFESELDQFRDSMEEMFSEQQIHLKQIMYRSECNDSALDGLIETQDDDVQLSGDICSGQIPNEQAVPNEREMVETSAETPGDESTKSLYLIRLFTQTCRLVSRLQSTAFHV